MAAVQSPVSDMLVTVKTREIQRGMLAEMRGDSSAAARHLLAAGHLELVLARDYAAADQASLAVRSRISAASCFWRAGQISEARQTLAELLQDHPERASEISRVREQLEKQPPPRKAS
jgi:hypothetical protein